MAVWRDPFTFGTPHVEMWREGMTVYEIVLAMNCLPAGFLKRGEVRVNGDVIPATMWHCVRPKGTTDAVPISVTFHMPLRGGGGRGGSVGKQIFAVVAAIALTIATAGISAGVLGPLGALSISGTYFAAGSVSAAVLSGAVGVAGALALSALTAPPSIKPANESTADSPAAASAEGNLVDPSGAVSRVIGTRKVFPQLACEPVTELVGEDEYVEAVYILAGPHDLSEIRIGDSAIATAEDIEYETREGWPSDAPIDLVARQGRTLTPQIELSPHQVERTSQQDLKAGPLPQQRLPVWHATSTRNSPDEVWLHLLLPEGLRTQVDAGAQIAIPFRFRIRRRGDAEWVNLPELHYSANAAQQVRAAVMLKWEANADSIPAVVASNGWSAAFKSVPAQTVAPPMGGWTANAAFSSGAGGDALYAGVEGTTNVANAHLVDNVATIYLDPAVFPKGVYDIEVKRGCAYSKSGLAQDSYLYNGVIRDFFGYYESGSLKKIPFSRENLSERAYLARVVSIWNEHPLPKPGFATIAIRARNRRVERVSTIASGYVQDWDGVGWNTWTTTSNPAPHYRDVLSGALNLDPLPTALRDDEGLVAWRAACADLDYTCDAIMEGRRIEEVLTLLGSCGYARPYQSELWGVTRDYDRSDEAPIQVFSARNARAFKFKKAFARLPDGFRVTYRDDNADYETDQVIVYRDGYNGGADRRLEQITYDGLLKPEKVRGRALFDLRQAEHRSTFYSFDAPLEAIVCRRGSLVAVQHDILSRHSGAARVRSLVAGGPGKIAGLNLDSIVDVVNEPDMLAVADMLAVQDMRRVGIQTGAAIRLTDGSVKVAAFSDATGPTDSVTFETEIDDVLLPCGPFDSGDIHEIEPGCLVIIGDIGSEYLRLIVSEIRPGPDLMASLTMVDEAPQLFA